MFGNKNAQKRENLKNRIMGAIENDRAELRDLIKDIETGIDGFKRAAKEAKRQGDLNHHIFSMWVDYLKMWKTHLVEEYTGPTRPAQVVSQFWGNFPVKSAEAAVEAALEYVN